jgi:hypothetical protein
LFVTKNGSSWLIATLSRKSLKDTAGDPRRCPRARSANVAADETLLVILSAWHGGMDQNPQRSSGSIASKPRGIDEEEAFSIIACMVITWEKR